jgi:hypothetical protein
MKICMHVMAPKPISAAYLINPSHQSAFICVYSAVAGQRFCKNVTAATNTHATVGELLDASSSI